MNADGEGEIILWEIEIKGDDNALAILRDSLTSEELSIREENGSFFLRAEEFTDLSDPGVIRSRAKDLISSLSDRCG